MWGGDRWGFEKAFDFVYSKKPDVELNRYESVCLSVCVCDCAVGVLWRPSSHWTNSCVDRDIR